MGGAHCRRLRLFVLHGFRVRGILLCRRVSLNKTLAMLGREGGCWVVLEGWGGGCVRVELDYARLTMRRKLHVD